MSTDQPRGCLTVTNLLLAAILGVMLAVAAFVGLSCVVVRGTLDATVKQLDKDAAKAKARPPR